MAGFRERFASYKASKKVMVWSWVGVAVLTMVVGFTWGGWVTGGSAVERAKAAANDAVAELAADVCFTRFMNASDVQVSLAALKAESSYARASSVEKGGWVTLASRDKPIQGAAKICADKLAAAEMPVAVVTPAADAAMVAVEPVAN